jgi:hypothetical protein
MIFPLSVTERKRRGHECVGYLYQGALDGLAKVCHQTCTRTRYSFCTRYVTLYLGLNQFQEREMLGGSPESREEFVLGWYPKQKLDIVRRKLLGENPARMTRMIVN